MRDQDIEAPRITGDDWPLAAAVLEHLEAETDGAVLREIVWDRAHTNDVIELRLADGRSLMVKHAKHEWARHRFEASRKAAALLRTETDVLAPRPIRLSHDLDARPLQAYWRIDLPTVAEVWNDLDADARSAAMVSLGGLLERLHEVEMPAWGSIDSGRDSGEKPLDRFLEWDIGERLLPATWAVWPSAVPALTSLLELVPEVGRRIGGRPATLAHNDVHLGNVLCRADGGEVHCLGFLDLDSAKAVPAESDAASLDVLHGRHFEQHLERRWRDEVWEGYRPPLDGWAMVFFRSLHLANLGFHSALVGHHEHATIVAAALDREVERARAGAPAGMVEPTRGA